MYETEVIKFEGLDVCKYCEHVVFWQTPNKYNNIQEETEDETVKSYIQANKRME
jgi:hypothetical protein